MKVGLYAGTHRDGTKEYYILTFNGDTDSIVFKFWGKIGRRNMAKVEFCKGDSSFSDVLAKALNERDRKGYVMTFKGSVSGATGLDEVIGFFELQGSDLALFAKIPENELRAIWPDCEIPDSLKNTFRNFDAPSGNPPESDVPEDPVDDMPSEEDLELLKQNPLFGIFG